jgi:hypothetical protein
MSKIMKQEDRTVCPGSLHTSDPESIFKLRIERSRIPASFPIKVARILQSLDQVH